MTHLSERNLTLVLETLITSPRWSSAAARVGVSEPTLFNWLARSRKAMRDADTSSIFWLRDYRGMDDWWHVFCGRMRRENLLVIEATIRDQTLHGISEPIRDANGRLVYELNEAAIREWDNADPADVEAIGGPKDYRYKHDADGNRIIATRVVQLPATTRNLIMQTMPDYQPKQRIDHRIDQRVQIQGSVQIGQKPAPVKALPRPGIDPQQLERLKAEARAELQREGKITKPENPAAVAATKGRPTDEPSVASESSVQQSQPRPNNDVKLGVYNPLPRDNDGEHPATQAEHYGIELGTGKGLRHYRG